MNKIGIIGCGWLGGKIASYFKSINWEIYTFNSSCSNKEKNLKQGYVAHQIDFSRDTISADFFIHFDAIIIALPMSRNKNIEELSLIFTNISNAIHKTKAIIFLCSSTGIYPQKKGFFNENSFKNEELDLKILSLEQIILNKLPNVNILRLGGLMGEERVFSNYFSSKDSLDAVNHIHYVDIVQIIKRMIFNKMNSKTYNVVAPLHPSKKAIFEFQKNKLEIDITTSDSRIISSDLLIKELDYTFIYPNPVYF